MNKPIGAIDGEKTILWIEGLLDVANANFELEKRSLLERIIRKLRSGELSAPSDQGEATRIKEVVKEIHTVLWDDSKFGLERHAAINALCNQALKDKGIEPIYP